jgi:ketosteroid isomerase-like protein
MALAVTVALTLFRPAVAWAQSPEGEVVATIDAYHVALASGDSTAALALLADDVTILESGAVEDKEHYRSGHLAGDMRFAQAVQRERGEIHVAVVGEVAWAWSTSVTQGRVGERDIDSQGAELMVLARTGDGWRIRAIHWSSRARRR